jgi:hypothetical protein
MALAFDGQPHVRDQTCRSCGRSYQWVSGLIKRDGHAFAVYYAQCHGHGDKAEAWVDVVVGSWDEPAYSDHATFSCRVSQAGAGAVDAPVASKGEAPFSGAMLSRSDALLDPRLPQVWEVVDFVVTTDPVLGAHVRASASGAPGGA